MALPMCPIHILGHLVQLSSYQVSLLNFLPSSVHRHVLTWFAALLATSYCLHYILGLLTHPLEIWCTWHHSSRLLSSPFKLDAQGPVHRDVGLSGGFGGSGWFLGTSSTSVWLDWFVEHTHYKCWVVRLTNIWGLKRVMTPSTPAEWSRKCRNSRLNLNHIKHLWDWLESWLAEYENPPNRVIEL